MKLAVKPMPRVREAMNVKIDRELKRRMKTYCAMRGVTMQDFLINLISEALEKAEGPKPGPS